MERKELVFDDINIEGMTAISLVENPAILVDWVAFSKNHKNRNTNFAVDEEKRMILGPIMIPDMDIERIDGEGEKYNVFFTKQTIEKMREAFLKGGKQNSFTYEHDFTINGVTVVEIWMSEDSKMDKSAFYGFKLPAGTLYALAKVDSDNIWEDIKAGRVKGFSLEGLFNNKPEKNSLINGLKLNLDMLKTKIAEFVSEAFNQQEEEKPEVEAKAEKFGTISVTDEQGNAVEVTFAGDVLEVGAEVLMTNEAGDQVPLPDGLYKADQLYTIVEGKLAEVADLPAEMEAETISKDEVKAAIVEVLDKFSQSMEKTIDTKIKDSIKNFKSELDETPAADSIITTPEDHGAPVGETWEQFRVRMKKEKNN